MIILLKKDIVYHINHTDSYKLQKGDYTAIDTSYIRSSIDSIVSNEYITLDEFLEETRKGNLLVVYNQRRYFLVRRYQCEIPKIYNGWWNY